MIVDGSVTSGSSQDLHVTSCWRHHHATVIAKATTVVNLRRDVDVILIFAYRGKISWIFGRCLRQGFVGYRGDKTSCATSIPSLFHHYPVLHSRITARDTMIQAKNLTTSLDYGDPSQATPGAIGNSWQKCQNVEQTHEQTRFINRVNMSCLQFFNLDELGCDGPKLVLMLDSVKNRRMTSYHLLPTPHSISSHAGNLFHFVQPFRTYKGQDKGKTERRWLKIYENSFSISKARVAATLL